MVSSHTQSTHCHQMLIRMLLTPAADHVTVLTGKLLRPVHTCCRKRRLCCPKQQQNRLQQQQRRRFWQQSRLFPDTKLSRHFRQQVWTGFIVHCLLWVIHDVFRGVCDIWAPGRSTWPMTPLIIRVTQQDAKSHPANGQTDRVMIVRQGETVQ